MKLENCSTLIDILSSNSIKKLYGMKIIPEEWFKRWLGHLYMVGIMCPRVKLTMIETNPNWPPMFRRVSKLCIWKLHNTSLVLVNICEKINKLSAISAGTSHYTIGNCWEMMGKFDEKLKIVLQEIEKKIWPIQRVCKLGIRMGHMNLPYSTLVP